MQHPVAELPPFYDDVCDKHGPCWHFTDGTGCADCYLDELNAKFPPVARGNPVRVFYRNKGRATFPGLCEKHGIAEIWTQSGFCSICRTMSGGERRAGSAAHRSPRAIARQRGDKAYMGYCEKHGDHAHSVAHGKCLSCFNTSGTPRGGVRGRSPRAEARHAGQRTYLADCAVHGTAAHSVMNGKCLSCFNSHGVRRPA